MLTEVKHSEEKTEEIVWYDIPYLAPKYAFPGEALIHDIWFDTDDIHIGPY